MTFVEKLERWYKNGLWNEQMVQEAVSKKKISQAEADKIIMLK